MRISDWSSDVCSSDLLPHLAIENYSQIQAKKETPESASENDVNPRIHVAPAKAGAAIDLPSSTGMCRQRPRRRRDDGFESIVAGGRRIELDVIFDAHALDHLELLLEIVDMMFIVLEYVGETVAVDLFKTGKAAGR